MSTAAKLQPSSTPSADPGSEITVAAADLSRAMKAAAAIVEGRNTIPILANVLLRADGDTLELLATDLDIQIELRVPLVGAGRLSTTVDAKRLDALAGAAAKGAQMTLALVDGRLVVRSGRSRWVLPVLPADDFPRLVSASLCGQVDFAAKPFVTAISRVGWSISDEPTRHYLCGIYVHPIDGKITFATTNGHTLVKAPLTEDWPEAAPAIILPAKAAHHLQKLGAEAEHVRLCWSDRVVRAEIGEIVLTSKVIDGTFPDYERVIPQESEAMIFDPEAMIGAIRRVALIATEKTRAVKITREQDRVIVSCSSPEHGAATEEVPVDCPVSRVETGVNSAFLSKMLTAIGGDTVEIHQADAGGQMLVRRKVRDGVVGVIMPMRV